MLDLHVHSNFSADSTEKIESIIIEAINRNIDIIAITDHIDYDYTDPSIKFEFNINDYFFEINRLKKIYGNKIKILKGVELGLQPHIIDKLNDFVNIYNFDFVIGSFHTCQKKDLYLKNFYKGKSNKEAWDIYLDEIYNTIYKFNNFNVLGHLDLIKRYSEEVRTIDISYYKAKLEKLFHLIVEKNIGIEVNTSGLRGDYGLNETLPSNKIIQIYKNCGGKIITIGSDSHTKDTLGENFNQVYNELKQIGFKNIYYFEEKKAKKY
ncbi:MAG: histidinol-phosphatase HisJ family protein [Bacillota bacterium]|nr:histidinol-phosphatase HisJ family protein [Bacillota bacterium]